MSPETLTPKVRKVYKDALEIQNASNISGVARHLVETIDAVRATGYSANADPAVALVIAKLADMVGLEFTWPRGREKHCENRAQGLGDES